MEPLLRDEFDKQVEALFDEHGASAFAATAGDSPSCSLVVDGEQVIAEVAGNPRFPYGAWCELNTAMIAGDAEKQARDWLTSGEAYNAYLCMYVPT